MLQSDTEKYDFIDALRGIAILGVILVHSSQAVAPTHATLLFVMTEGARGVQLFYVASALTLCMSWMARSSHESFPVRNFYIRRFFRIAPMFYLAILTYTLLNGFAPAYWSPNGIEWWFIPLTALFLHGFHPETIASVVPGGWSIAVEASFYLILPFLLIFIRSPRSWVLFFGVSLFLFAANKVIWPHIFFYPEDQRYLVGGFSFMNFFGQLPVFVMGIFCYLLLRERFPRKLVAVFGCSLFVVLLIAFRYPHCLLPHHLVAGALFSVFALLLANWPTRLLVNKATTTLGKLSFSMYLTHFAILACFHRIGFSDIFPKSNIASFSYFLSVVSATAFVALFFWNFVEKPGIALGRRLIEKLEQAKDPGQGKSANGRWRPGCIGSRRGSRI